MMGADVLTQKRTPYSKVKLKWSVLVEMYFYVFNNVKKTDKGCRKGRARV
jgi:hypothetical protein